MGMIAAKHTDLVVGMDMHMIQPPPPAPPMMVPHPVVGMILDPSDYDPAACTVFVNGLPRARAGSMCVMSPPHIPIGGMFVKPPLSEAEVYQGSSTVTADGDAMSAGNHQVLGCHDIGAPAPARAWKTGGAKSLMKAGSMVIALPGGAPVFVGGAPATSARGQTAGDVETESVQRTVNFAVSFALNGIERRNEPCEVDVDGTVNGEVTQTDVRGRIAVSVPIDAVELTVTFAKGTPSEQAWKYRLFHLELPDTELGAKQRLVNLGFLVGPADAATDEDVKGAALAFQAHARISGTGVLDAATMTKLAEAHGA